MPALDSVGQPINPEDLGPLGQAQRTAARRDETSRRLEEAKLAAPALQAAALRAQEGYDVQKERLAAIEARLLADRRRLAELAEAHALLHGEDLSPAAGKIAARILALREALTATATARDEVSRAMIGPGSASSANRTAIAELTAQLEAEDGALGEYGVLSTHPRLRAAIDGVLSRFE